MKQGAELLCLLPPALSVGSRWWSSPGAGQTIKEPLVLGMLILCSALALGILWSDHPELGFKVWRRYFAFLVFIPYLSLLNKQRLLWAISGLLIGYFGTLLASTSG